MRNNSGENLWGMRIVAFIMALMLFTFVSYENSQRVQSTNPGDGASITGVEVLEDVLININVDRERYYVSGIPETAEVRLRGPQSLILQTLATQNITVETPDLNELGLGVHEIELYIEGLSDQIEYRIDPMTVTVTIEERVSETFNLSIEFNEEDVDEGYEAGEPELSQTQVLVTGSATAIANVAAVQVVIPSEEEEYTDSINMSLPVVVTGREGELMDVSVEPGEVNVFIPIERPAKTVPLTLKEVGDTNEDYEYNVSFASGQPEVITITGSREQLDQVQEWPIEVDLSGIEADTELELPVGTYNGISETDMETVAVVIEVEGVSSVEENTAASRNTDTDNSSDENETEAGTASSRSRSATIDNNDESTSEAASEESIRGSTPPNSDSEEQDTGSQTRTTNDTDENNTRE